MMNASRHYLSAAETAQLIRKALKAAFPGTKFSVRSSTYAGGASIRVGYTNGPKASDVEKITNLYQGATFDGMQDLKEYHDSLIMTDKGLENVHFGADWVFVNREYDEQTFSAMLARVMAGMRKSDDSPVTNDREFGFLAYRDEELSKLDLIGRDGNAHEWTHRVLSQMTL